MEIAEALNRWRRKSGLIRRCRAMDTGEAALFPVDVTSSSVANGQDIPSGLVYGAYLGNETRNIVFKRGTDSDYLCSAFRNDLRHYACAFLNTGGGRVGVGVDDGGVARGLQLKRREEDQARLLVHTIMRGFDPPVLPSSYSMVFLPAVRPGPEGRTLKVLRLTFTASPAFAHPSLYQTDQGEVFFKRDGSVEGPLTAAAIQEWVRQVGEAFIIAIIGARSKKWSGEVSRLQHHVDRLLAHYRLQNHNRAPKSVIGALSSSGTQPGPSSHSTSTENRARQIPMFLVSSNCCEWLWEIVHSGKIYSSVTQSPTL
ncbi:schlafen-like protein 1 [Centroberyx gerrardi]